MSASGVEVRGLTKRFGDIVALNDVSLVVKPGEFLTLLGPSGCGKTTLLRLIAGFETPDAGSVRLSGEDVTSVPAQRRNVNQVFQNYALFPHLTVYDNIAFGLRMQGMSVRDVATRVTETVALVALEGCEKRKPHELSGGQRQRVGLARAIAPRPAVLLLDEPLSALDARLRQTMQLELKQLQRRLGMTFIFVTHDQEEALTMSDRIALMHRGRIEQLDEVHALYHRPATAFAAEFIGEANLLSAEWISATDSGVMLRLGRETELVLPAAAWPKAQRSAQLAIRPEKIHLTRERIEGPNVFEVRVEEEIFRGMLDRFVLATPDGLRLIAVAANGSALRDSIHAGDGIWAAIHAEDVVVLPPASPKVDVASVR
jgi:spermidine/putrescine ABC transporter ATP-binding subunit